MSEAAPLPAGFTVGHWSDPKALTGCTVVIPPPGSVGGVAVAGGGPGSRETDVLRPLAGASEASAVLLTGGSAFGLAAADGVVRWLEEQGRGYPTAAGRVPLVAAAVIYDIASGDPSVRPGPEQGHEAAASAVAGVPQRGAVGAGTGATVGKVLGRERCARGGVGYAALVTGTGATVAAVAVVNASGEVLAEDGSVLAGPTGDDGEPVRSAEAVAAMKEAPAIRAAEESGELENSTLVCVCTDAALDKRGCNMVARAATGGIARTIDPVFTPVDGDVAFCLSSGEGTPDPFASFQVGAAAATVTAAAIRDGVRAAG